MVRDIKEKEKRLEEITGKLHWYPKSYSLAETYIEQKEVRGNNRQGGDIGLGILLVPKV